MPQDPDDILAGMQEANEPASILSAEEIADARKAAAERVERAMKDAEFARIVAEEEERLRREQGKRTGTPDMDEKVNILIDLPEIADRIIINGTEYHHGHTYSVERHVANSLREIMQRGHRHQMELDGKSLEEAYRRTSPQAMSMTTGAKVPVPEGV